MTLHVFVDNSNIFGGAQRVAKHTEAYVPWPAIRLYVRNFITLIEGSQPVCTRVYAGSVPPGSEDLWRYARDMRYNTDLLRKVEKDDGRLAEQGVDELLHLKIANVLLDTDQPEVLVLATGDGSITTYGTGFGLQAERALKRGWKVEVWSWREQLSGTFAKLGKRYPGQLRVHELDPFYYAITFVKGGLYTVPRSIGPIALGTRAVNVASRVVSPLMSGLKVY